MPREQLRSRREPAPPPGDVSLRRIPWAEILLTGAFVSGWLSLTLGLARLLVPEVWLISVGLLLISVGGWRMLRTVAVEGLYALTRPKKAAPDA